MGEEYRKVTNLDTGEVIATRVKIAQDFISRSVGLLGRKSLEEDEALLIKPCSSIHTFFMKFPIDVVFLDRQARVLKTRGALSPWRLFGCPFRAYMVLELAPGKLKRSSIELNNILEIE